MSSLAEQKLWGALNRDQLLREFPRLDDATRERMVSMLRSRLPGDRVLFSPDELIPYSFDATGERHRPDVVVLPRSREEVITAVEVAREYGCYIIGRGAATNLSGGTMPVVGGMVISLARMKRILRIDYNNRVAVVEPGAVNAVLQEMLKPHGFFYPPDPSSHRISTLGGNVAENSGGPHCVKYGVTTNHVLQAEIVTVDGDILRLPCTRDWRPGYDLTGLVTGSEGTMGLITELTLAISPLPDRTQTMLAVFATVPAALRCVSAIISAKVIPATLELLDKVSLEIIEAYVHAGYPAGAEAVLLIEVDGSPHAVEQQTETVRQVAMAQGAVEFRLATTEAEAEALWRGRRAHYGAAARVAPHLWVQDVTVPRPLLAEMMQEVLAIGQRYGFAILTAAHAGDGNLHPTIPYDPEDAKAVARMREADQEILKACVRYGGAITGEHGIGIDKVENLALMYGDAELKVMMALKEVFDPDRRLNPFKAVPFPVRPLTDDPVRPGGDGGEETVIEPRSADEVADAVVRARRSGRRMMVRGRGRRQRLAAHDGDVVLSTVRMAGMVDFDPDNLTCEVEAGMTAADLAQQLARAGFELAGAEHFSDETVGGLVAANARFWRDSFGLGWRDAVTGVEWVDGRGQILRFGRKTMKNVAGYDVSKLAVGSWGSLGVITKIILRLKPRLTPRWLGQITGPVDELLRLGIRLGGLSARPQGVLVQRQGSQTQMFLLAQGVEADVIRKRSQAVAGGLTIDWVDDVDVWPTLEQGRLQRFYRALEQGAYQEGGIEPEELLTVAERLSGDLDACFFPGSGAYEIYGEVGEDLPGATRRLTGGECTVRKDPRLAGIDEGIRRVFDPAGVFLY